MEARVRQQPRELRGWDLDGPLGGGADRSWSSLDPEVHTLLVGRFPHTQLKSSEAPPSNLMEPWPGAATCTTPARGQQNRGNKGKRKCAAHPLQHSRLRKGSGTFSGAPDLW